MSRLHTAEFECEVITPMFLGGADPNKPELRASSFRGALRFWFRAMMGGRGFTDPQRLFAEEERVFGSTARGGSVAIRLEAPSSIETRKGEEFVKNRDSGIAYLWYSVKLGKANDKSYIVPSTTFRCILSSTKSDDLSKAVDSLYLLSKLGGIGTRARRCAGSFDVKLNSSSVVSTIDFNSTLSVNIKKFETTERSMHEVPTFSLLHPDFTTVWIAENAKNNDWQKLIEQLGAQFKKFRKTRGAGEGGDYDKVKDFISNSRNVNEVERAAFGLPLKFQYRSLPERKNSTNIELTSNDGKINRRASPLMLSICRDDGKLNIVATHFESVFKPNGTDVKIGGRNTRAGGSKIINDFISGIDSIKINKVFGAK